jgi:hypothetical protein
LTPNLRIDPLSVSTASMSNGLSASGRSSTASGVVVDVASGVSHIGQVVQLDGELAIEISMFKEVSSNLMAVDRERSWSSDQLIILVGLDRRTWLH